MHRQTETPTFSPKQKLTTFIYSLKFRLMVYITVILVLVVGVPMGFFIYQLDRNYREFSENMVETTAQVIYQFLFQSMMDNNPEGLQRNLELLAMEPTIELVRIFRPDGTILYSSHPEEIHSNAYERPDFIVTFDSVSHQTETFAHKGNIFSHHHPIYVQKECTRCHENEGSIIAVMDVHARFSPSEQIYALAKNLMLFSGVFIIFLLWVTLNFLYQNQFESPLKKFLEGFQELARGNLNFQMEIKGRDEISRMAENFNRMVKELRQAREREEQFVIEQLARADRLVTLGEIAAEMAHEVNNPAGIILSRAELLKDELAEKIPDNNVLEELDIIIQQTGKIAETTRSILHYARKLPQAFSQIDLKEVIHHSVKILEPRLRKRNVEVQLQLPEEVATVKGNFNQLEQVFCNLINNSVDALGETGGTIKISIEKMRLDKQSTGYRIIYKDNGPGIPMGIRQKIFSPFFTTKAKENGTGLGLYIVKNIIKNHGGKIYLDDSVTEGAQFIIELRADEQTA